MIKLIVEEISKVLTERRFIGKFLGIGISTRVLIIVGFFLKVIFRYLFPSGRIQRVKLYKASRR